MDTKSKKPFAGFAGGRVFVPFEFLSNALKKRALFHLKEGMGVTMSEKEFRFRLKEKEISSEVILQGKFKIL